MKLTIIPVDNAVYKDGVAHSGLDLSMAPANVHALQWNNVKGWIEFVEDDDGNKSANQQITELPSWANDALAAWEAVNAAELAAIAAIAETSGVAQQPISSGAQNL
jgi:hypothetical protein